MQITLHVDPLRDYVTPLIRESDAEGNLLREWISEDYFQPEGSPLWFPQKFTFRETAHRNPWKRKPHRPLHVREERRLAECQDSRRSLYRRAEAQLHAAR